MTSCTKARRDAVKVSGWSKWRLRCQPRMARLSTHQDGQVNELLAQTEVRDIPTPHLVRPDNRQPVPQIRVSWVGISPLRRPRGAPRALPAEAHLAHEPRHMLAIDLDVFTGQQGDDPPIAIGWTCRRETLDRGFQGSLITARRPVVMAAAGTPEPLADLAHGILVSERLHDRPLGLDRWCKMVVAFLKMLCSRVKRPRSRSNSPIREPSWPLWCSEVANTEAARVRNVFMKGYQIVGAGAVASSASRLAPLVEGRVHSAS